MKKQKSIQSVLFRTYFYILITVMIVLMVIFNTSEAEKIKNNAFKLINQNVNTISSYIDDEAKTLNTVAQNIAYSNLIKQRFLNYLDYEKSDKYDQVIAYDNLQNTKILIDMLIAILGPNQPVVQIYLYSLDQGVFGVGLDTSTSKASAKDAFWYEPLLESEHNRLIVCDHDERLEKFYTYEDGANFISLYQMYYNTYNNPVGFIEVKNPISFLTKRVNNITRSYNENIFIFDPTGKAVYPEFLNQQHAEFYSSIIKQHDAYPSYDAVTYKYDDNNYLFYKVSEATGFTVAIAVTNSSLLKPVYDYIKVNIFIIILVALAMMLLSYIAARIITTPIKKIYRQVQSFRLDLSGQNNNSFPDINTHIIELNTLYSALIKMQRKALESMEKEITLQNQEMQSRMLALQSQMNPHFLYNSLATIQSMADEHMYDEIYFMCQSMSNILRYLSSDTDTLVPLRLDIENTKNYLSCMKIRYEDDLFYEISIPDEMMDVKIPKLCTQLLVENSIKFTTKSIKPPWKVSIKGIITKTHWELSISDNGPGFSESEIEILNQKIQEINRTGLLPNLEIGGMGLMNIYIRFKLIYKGSHIFRISNLANGGALVTIGGKTDE